MKQYIIFALLSFCISVHANEKPNAFNIQFDINADTYDIDEEKIIADALKQLEIEEQAANNNPKHAATLQAMQKDLLDKQTRQSKLEDTNNQLDNFLQNCATNPEQMLNANPKLVAALQKKDIQQGVVFLGGIPTAFIAGIATAIINPTLITHNKAAQKVALREFLISWFEVTKKVTYTSDALNIKASLHAADALTGLALHALDSYRSPEQGTALHASSSIASSLIKYSLKPVETKTVVGNNHVLILSNANILSAMTNTAEQTIQQLSNHTLPKASELARTLAMHVGLEISYNITAQILRQVTIPILGKMAQMMKLPSETPEGIIDACIPENYEPNNYLQHIVKWGISCGTCFATYSAYTALTNALMTLYAQCQPGV